MVSLDVDARAAQLDPIAETSLAISQTNSVTPSFSLELQSGASVWSFRFLLVLGSWFHIADCGCCARWLLAEGSLVNRELGGGGLHWAPSFR